MALVGNIIGASAQSVNQLIGTNCLNGLAAAGQLSFNVIIGELVPNRQRGPFNALVLSTSIPFAVFGPPVARAFYSNTALQWRWSYILGCIINAVAAATFFFFYHPPSYEQLHVGGKSMMRQLKGLDWAGIFLFTAGLVLFLVGLNWGGQAYPWDSKEVLCTLIFGIGTLIGFGFWEAYSGHESPLIPMSLFKNIKYDAIVACASIGAMVYYSMTVLWPTLIGALFTTDVTEVGWLSCAVGGGLLLGQIAGGFGIRYLPRMKIQMTVASVIMVAFVAALASTTEYSRNRTVAFLLVGTMAAGYIENLSLSSMALVWEPEDIGLVGKLFQDFVIELFRANSCCSWCHGKRSDCLLINCNISLLKYIGQPIDEISSQIRYSSSNRSWASPRFTSTAICWYHFWKFFGCPWIHASCWGSCRACCEARVLDVFPNSLSMYCSIRCNNLSSSDNQPEC